MRHQNDRKDLYAYRCPTRIDLAGGTLDCWPLYAVIPQPCVVLNIPINIYTQAIVEPLKGPEIIWRQIGLNTQQTKGEAPNKEAIGKKDKDKAQKNQKSKDHNNRSDKTAGRQKTQATHCNFSTYTKELKFDNLEHFLQPQNDQPQNDQSQSDQPQSGQSQNGQSQNNRLNLIQCIAKAFRIDTGFRLTTQSQSPIGAGLGASSSLCMAIIRAFEDMCGGDWRLDDMDWIEVAHNIEARALHCPTGTQDYVPAFFNSCQLSREQLKAEPLGHQPGLNPPTPSKQVNKSARSRLQQDRPPEAYDHLDQFSKMYILHYSDVGLSIENLSISKEVTDCMLLVYTGQPHHSGLNNWEVLKLALASPNNNTLDSLYKISELSSKMLKCFHRKYLIDFGSNQKYDTEDLQSDIVTLWQQEFEARCQLSPSFVSPRIKELKELVTPYGVKAIKVCGAGGGGCCVLWADPSDHKAIAQVCRENDFTVLNFQVLS